MSNPQQSVQKLWNYRNILRDDGLFFRPHSIPARQDGDYVEQLTIPLFLKMADEQAKPPFNPLSLEGFGGAGKPSPIPKGFGRDAMLALEAVVSASLQRATCLRQSIPEKAFTGELA